MRAIFTLLILLLCCFPVSAVEVGSGVIFQTPTTNATFHIATSFNCTKISVYSDALNINTGNIAASNATQEVNISFENLNDTTQGINFTSNATIDILTITNGFANFLVINNFYYTVSTQSEENTLQKFIATNGFITFVIIPAGSYIIEKGELTHHFSENAFLFYDEMESGLTDFKNSMGRYLVWGILFFAVGLAFTLFAKIKQTLIGGK